MTEMYNVFERVLATWHIKKKLKLLKKVIFIGTLAKFYLSNLVSCYTLVMLRTSEDPHVKMGCDMECDLKIE